MLRQIVVADGAIFGFTSLIAVAQRHLLKPDGRRAIAHLVFQIGQRTVDLCLQSSNFMGLFINPARQ